jgi:hypothetical protein
MLDADVLRWGSIRCAVVGQLMLSLVFGYQRHLLHGHTHSTAVGCLLLSFVTIRHCPAMLHCSLRCGCVQPVDRLKLSSFKVARLQHASISRAWAAAAAAQPAQAALSARCFSQPLVTACRAAEACNS